MKILIPTSRDPGQIGGTSTHIVMLVSGLNETVHHARPLYLGAAIPGMLRNFSVVWPGGALNRVRTGWGMMYAAEMRGRLMAVVTARELARAAEAGEPWQVLNAQEVYSIPYLREVADQFSVPLVVTLHGYPLYESMSEGYTAASRMGRHFLMRAELRALRLADAVVTVDTRLYRHALGLVPERSDSVYTLMNFIDTSVFAPPDDAAEEARVRRDLRAGWGVPEDKIVLFCPRRLVKKNGVIYPSLALATMSPADRDRFLLLHAGEGGEREEMERIISAEHLEKNIRLLGGQGPDAILDLYRLADIVLVPSVHSENVEEATSLSALEAMASGRPLIAGNVGGLAEMVSDGETGLLVPGDEGGMDTEALAIAILRLAGDPAAGARMAETARRYVVQNHSHLRAAAAYAEIYGRAIRDRDPAGAIAGLVPGTPVAATELASTSETATAARPELAAAAFAGGSEKVATESPWPSRSVLGFRLDLVDVESAARWLAAQAEGPADGATRIAVSFNPELVVTAQEDPDAAEALLGADLCYPDGVGAVWAAGRQGPSPERVPGIDLAGRLLEIAAERRLPVFFLGAAEGVAAEAARRQVDRLPGLKVVGTHHGYFSPSAEEEVVREVRGSGASIVLAALGAPRQEVFLFRHRKELGAAVALGVGGSFDVWAGVVKRAPVWVQKARVEWLYRLARDPRRIRRQLALARFATEVVRWSPDDYGPPRRGRIRDDRERSSR